MPWRLYRYILGELLRQVCLTTAILVTIIAFGAVIKPLAGDSVLTAGQALKYIALAMIPMMQYALPFAAGFAATLTLHRFASDNEILAMATSGMSYRAIFAPVLALGVVLLLIMVILTQAVIPRFFGLMAATLTGDVKQLISTSIDRGVPFAFSDLQIYAEDFESIDDPETGANERILLRRVVAAQLGEDGAPASDVTAAGAVIDLYDLENGTFMKMALEDTVSWDASSSTLRGFPRLEPTHAIPVPRPDRSDPENLTRWQLADARAHPERSLMVEEVRMVLLKTINDYLVSKALNEQLETDGALVITKSGPIDRSYRIEAESIQEGVLQPRADELVVVTEMVDGAPSRKFTTNTATLGRQRMLGPLGELFMLEMSGVDVESLEVALRPNRRESLAVSGLSAGQDVWQYPGGTPLRELLDVAEPLREESPAIEHGVRFVNVRIDSLMGLIDGQVLRRSTLACTAGLLLLLGAVLAVLLRNVPPLGVYVFAFLPALLDLILIASGTGMVRNGDAATGFVLAWSGNAILVILIGLSFFKVSRN
ncbi:MAG: LptF/LptG family permease [Phycisphaerales bacterium]|nr:LptF/LptG family permease [Phycisphaerales bacterium]